MLICITVRSFLHASNTVSMDIVVYCHGLLSHERIRNLLPLLINL